MSRRIQNPEGFYSKDWDVDKQEEDEWQTPDKFQKISQMVFHNGVLESHPETIILISLYLNLLTAYIYKYFVLDYNK